MVARATEVVSIPPQFAVQRTRSKRSVLKFSFWLRKRDLWFDFAFPDILLLPATPAPAPSLLTNEQIVSGPTLAATEKAIRKARAKGMPVVFVQHIANGASPFFNAETEGVKLHERVRAAVDGAPIVVKQHADAFEGTTLHETLQGLGANELIVCGMMTQNCVTHTAVSRKADEYQKVTVLTDASTTVSEMLHLIAVAGLSPRVAISTVDGALA